MMMRANRRSLVPAVESLDRLVLLDSAPSGLPPAYEPPQMTAAEYQAHEQAMQSYEAMVTNPDVQPGYPDVGSLVVQGYGDYGARLLGLPDPGPAVPPTGTPDNPVPMGQHVLDAALSQALVGQNNYDPVATIVAPYNPETSPPPQQDGQPPFLYDPISYS